MTSAMRQALAKQPFEQKLLQVSQLVATAQTLKTTRSLEKTGDVKEGETVNSLFAQCPSPLTALPKPSRSKK